MQNCFIGYLHTTQFKLSYNELWSANDIGWSSVMLFSGGAVRYQTDHAHVTVTSYVWLFVGIHWVNAARLAFVNLLRKWMDITQVL